MGSLNLNSSVEWLIWQQTVLIILSAVIRHINILFWICCAQRNSKVTFTIELVYRPAPSWYFSNQFQLLLLGLLKAPFQSWCPYKLKHFLSPYCLPDDQQTLEFLTLPNDTLIFSLFILIYLHPMLHPNLTYILPKYVPYFPSSTVFILPDPFFHLQKPSIFPLLQDSSEMPT